MKLLICTIFTYYLLILPAYSTFVSNVTATIVSPSNTSTSTLNTTKPNLIQNDALRQKNYNTQMPNYKIAYNQGGATLAAFPVLSKIASIKRERSSADYNRPLDIGQTSSGLTPQLQKLLQVPINKREATTGNKTEEKRETNSQKKVFAKHSNFGSNAYKQGGYEGSPDTQAASVKNFLGTMTRTVGKGSTRNQFGGYGSNFGSQSYSGMSNVGSENPWNSQQEQVFPSQNSNNGFGISGDYSSQYNQNSAQSSFGTTVDGTGINNNGQRSDMNSMNFEVPSNMNGMSGGTDNYGTSNNMQNQWNSGSAFLNSGGINNAGVGSQSGVNFGMNQQGTNNYGINTNGNIGEINNGMNGYTGMYVTPSVTNNYGITTDYSNLNANTGFNNFNSIGYPNVNSQSINNYGINTNDYSTPNSQNSGTFGINGGGGDLSNINVNTFTSNTAASGFPQNNNYENTGGIDYSNMNNNNNENFGINNGDSFSTQTANMGSNDNAWKNNLNNNNNAYTGSINYPGTGMMTNLGTSNTNFFGTNKNGGSGSSFSNLGIGTNSGMSNVNYGINGNSGFTNVNSMPSPVGGFNNINTPMTNTGVGTTASNGIFSNNGGNDGMSNGINGGLGSSDYNSNNNGGNFEISGNGDSMSGNEYNSMNYASSGGGSTGMNVNAEYSSQMNGENQQPFSLGQQQTGFSANVGTPQTTFENSQQSIQTQTNQQNSFGYPSNFGPVINQMTSQPMQQSFSTSNGQQGIISSMGQEFGKPTANTQTYPGASNNYLNIAHNIAQQQTYNNVHGSQYNSVPPQTYNHNTGVINNVPSSAYNSVSSIPQFPGSNTPSLSGGRFSSYGTSTHSGHISHPPTKSNVYTVVAPIPKTSANSDATQAKISEKPPPPTTYKHGSNVYTTTYTGFDTAASTFSGNEKIGDAYSDKYGDSETINIYQTKPKPLSEYFFS